MDKKKVVERNLVMETIKDAIFLLTQRGYLTLQVPDLVYEFSGKIGKKTKSQTENIPDDWVCFLVDNIPVFKDTVQCFLFLTRKGYEANKEKIKVGFNTIQDRGYAWKDFEKYAKNHFAKIEKNLDKKKAQLRNKLKELENFTV